MSEMTAMTIALHVQGQVVDLRIPRYVTEKELKEILKDALSVIHIQLSEPFELKVINKKIKIDPTVLLSHYPLGDGDQLLIVEKEEKK